MRFLDGCLFGSAVGVVILVAAAIAPANVALPPVSDEDLAMDLMAAELAPSSVFDLYAPTGIWFTRF